MTVPVDEIIAQITARLQTLQWLVGLSLAWNTLLIGVAVGLVWKYR
jgi:hypothetical protein